MAAQLVASQVVLSSTGLVSYVVGTFKLMNAVMKEQTVNCKEQFHIPDLLHKLQ
jgi:hypothetical protein